jgi:succinate dehydrogenase / fumarate reductase iron-sulfur subunit
MATTFRIRRFDPASGDAPRYDEYALDVPEGATVLEALLRIQAEQDGTLAFRYACRGAVCGSCAMILNGEVGLACRTQVHALEGDAVTVEPLPNLPLVRDLVVDMDVFLAKDTAVVPWLEPRGEAPERERLVSPEGWKEAEPYTNCILCASCHGVCPVASRDPDYLGPAALGKHYRFLSDVRDGADAERLALVAGEHGVDGCDVVWNCARVCPKRVPPTKGILATRERIAALREGGGDR